VFQVAFYAIRQRDGLSLFYSSRASRKGHNTLPPSCTWLLRDAMLFEWRMPWIAVGFSVHRKRNACRIGMRCIIRSVQRLPCRQGKEGICARRQREPTWGTCRRTVLHRNELTAWRCGTWHLPRSVTLDGLRYVTCLASEGDVLYFSGRSVFIFSFDATAEQLLGGFHQIFAKIRVCGVIR